MQPIQFVAQGAEEIEQLYRHLLSGSWEIAGYAIAKANPAPGVEIVAPKCWVLPQQTKEFTKVFDLWCSGKLICDYTIDGIFPREDKELTVLRCNFRFLDSEGEQVISFALTLSYTYHAQLVDAVIATNKIEIAAASPVFSNLPPTFLQHNFGIPSLVFEFGDVVKVTPVIYKHEAENNA